MVLPFMCESRPRTEQVRREKLKQLEEERRKEVEEEERLIADEAAKIKRSRSFCRIQKLLFEQGHLSRQKQALSGIEGQLTKRAPIADIPLVLHCEVIPNLLL